MPNDENAKSKLAAWRKDWCLFATEALGVSLDKEQEAIVRSVQENKMTSVASGTARGKDFVTAVVAICFMYLTPKWNKKGELIKNTKVILSAPTARQVENIMTPEFTRLFMRAINKGVNLPGRLVGNDIRTEYKEWFLTGFKSDDTNMEAWSGLHAPNILFAITEATGISETIFNAIEGNLQGEFTRLLIVFNPNIPTGYAAASQKSPRWHKFRLDSLNAPNVLKRNNEIPGQVDYEWVKDKVNTWCTIIAESDYIEDEGDFKWEGLYYRPNDLFRVKVRGMFPKVSSDVLIPLHWIEAAQKRYKLQQQQGWHIAKTLRLGVDVAGMGRDSSCFCYRYDNYVDRFEMIQSGGVANHMQVAGKVKVDIEKSISAEAFIDTIGEGAGVYSRLVEKKVKNVFSVKFSESAEWKDKPLKDVTGQYEFLNMRAYLYWAVRDWLNPINKMEAMLPVDDELTQELTETKWEFMSNGKIKIEPKEEIKKRLGRSPDKSDALANTFYPTAHTHNAKMQDLSKFAGAFR
jgi:hypothetical protein